MKPKKAELTLVNKNNEEQGDPIPVDFNPQQLQVSYQGHGSNCPQTNNSQSRTPSGSANTQSCQSTGYSSSLTTELLFDTSDDGSDVRHETLKIIRMLQRTDDDASSESNKKEAPRVRFQWGSFLYYGHITRLSETLNYFSEGGVPLRATLTLNMSSDELDKIDTEQENGATAGAGAGAGAGVGTSPLTTTQSGDTIQDLAARAGRNWKEVASANGIDNPRQVQAGTVIDIQARMSR